MVKIKPKSIRDQANSSYSVVSQNPMWWRSAIAALRANKMDVWPYLPSWHKAWIIATVEEDILINNALGG